MIRHSLSKLRHFAGQITFVATIAVGIAGTIGSFVRPALAVDNTWIFDANGNWDDGSKWFLGIPPEGSGITAVIDDGDTAVTVTLDSSHAVDALSLGSDDTLLIQSGASSVSLTSNSSFTNAGTINLTGTDVQTTFLSMAGGDGNDTLTNTGTLNFQVGAGTGSRVFTGNLVNNGTVNVDLDAHFNKNNATYANNGQLTVPSGKTLMISGGGTLNQNVGGTFTLSGELENNTFNMNGGTLNFGASALVDNGNFNYLGGTIAGDVKLRNTVFTIGVGTAPETFQLNHGNTLASNVGAGHTINIESNASSVQLQSNSSFTNAGTINLTGTDVQTTFLSMAGGDGNDTLTNTGTLNFQVGAGTGSRVFTGNLVNNGTVNVDLDAHFNKNNATYANNGQLTVPSGKTLMISGGGTLNQNVGGTFTLSGELENNTFNMNGGTLNFGASALVDNGNFNYLGGTIAGDVKLRNTVFTIGVGTAPETFQLNHGNTLASNVGAGHTINIESNASSVQLQSNSSFTNAGTINLTGTDVQTTFLSMAGGDGNDTLTNTGTLNFQVGAGTGSRVFTGNLVNNGTVNVDLDAHFNKNNATYANNGQLTVPSGKTLMISGGGTLNQNVGGTFTLSGELENNTFNMNGGTLNFGASALVDNGNFNYLGGTIAGDVKLRNTVFTIGVGTAPETFQLNHGNTLASNVGAGHTINIESNASSVQLQSNSSFTNAGTINLTGTDVQTTFLSMAGGDGNDTLTNTGTLNFQVGAGTGSRVFTGNLVNNGTVNVDLDAHFNKNNGTYTNNSLLKISNGATLSITGAGSLTNHSGTTLTGGTFDIKGTLRFPGAIIHTNQAELILRGAGSTIRNDSDSSNALADLATNGVSGKLRLFEGRDFVTSGSTFTNDGVLELGGTSFIYSFFLFGPAFNNTATGQIVGAGTIEGFSSQVNLSSSGTIAPGTATTAGILQINGTFTQNATGALSIGIGGTNNSNPQSPQFDVLNSTFSATLNGILQLSLFNGFTPSSADSFSILNSGLLTGTFANVANGQRLNTSGGEGSFVVNYNTGLGDVILSNFALAADYNLNGIVDAADYVLWRKSPGSYGGPGGYATWRANFGRSTLGSGAGSLASSTVPEPSSISILLIGLAALVGRRRTIVR